MLLRESSSLGAPGVPAAAVREFSEVERLDPKPLSHRETRPSKWLRSATVAGHEHAQALHLNQRLGVKPLHLEPQLLEGLINQEAMKPGKGNDFFDSESSPRISPGFMVSCLNFCFGRHNRSRVGLRRGLFNAFAVSCCLGFVGCGDRPGADAKDKNAKAAVKKAVVTEISWPMTRGGPALSGNVAAKLPIDPTTAWTFAASGPVTAEAAIVSGRVYVGTAKGTLHCLSADSGQELWRFETKDAITAAPAVSAGKVFVSSTDGRLYALNADSGTEAWNFASEDKISSGAIAIRSPDGTSDWVLVNGYDGTTRVLDAPDGKVIWTYKTDDYINGSPAVVDGRFLVFGGCDAQLHVVNLKDGSLVHKIETSAQIPASIATFGTMAFCGNYANEAVAFDVVGGKVAWVYKDRALPFFSSPAVNERLVLIGSRDKHLHALDRQKGEAVWKFQTGGRVEGSPVVFADGVVFGSTDGRLYAANLEAGQELWQLELGESLVASPAFGGQQIIIGGEKGTVFAIRARAPSKT